MTSTPTPSPWPRFAAVADLVAVLGLAAVPGLVDVPDLVAALAEPLPLAAAARLLLTGPVRTTPPLGFEAGDVAAPAVALPTIGRLRNRMCCCPSVHTLVVTQ